jgi:serine phosphatase RsbU (regulator of sigma subunit)
MNKALQINKIPLVLLFFFQAILPLSGQSSFDNATRAVFIFDLSQYVDFGKEFRDTSVFRIGVLDDTTDLFFELGRLRNQRPQIQNRPVHILLFRNEDAIRYTEVLFVNRARGFRADRVSSAIAGKKTLLLTEGYPFRESMINFVVTREGKLRFEANDELITAAGLSVNPNILFQAVKSREEWEELFIRASEEIEAQKRQIAAQKAILDSLDMEVKARELTLMEKEEMLSRQLSQINDQLVKIDRQAGQIESQREEITTQKALIAGQMEEARLQRDTLEFQKRDISIQVQRINAQLEQIFSQDQVIKVQLEAIEKQKLLMWFFIIALLLLAMVAYYIFRSYRIKREANRKLEEKNETISRQRDEMEVQRDQIAYQKKHITDSILYAKRIQTALLPSIELFTDRIDHFVLYKPLDIVSGDFYWVASKDNLEVIIVADCTGHGVPGAFMSMLSVTLLNEIINVKDIVEPDIILNELRDEIIRALKQSEEDDRVKDGLDMAVCTIDFSKDTVYFAGANIPLILVRGDELIQYRGDKMPVSIHYSMQPFCKQVINLMKGDCLYMFTDGYCDQFGGPEQKKFLSSRLKEKLVIISQLPMMEQGERLDEAFEEWRGNAPQVDDVAMVGIRY